MTRITLLRASSLIAIILFVASCGGDSSEENGGGGSGGSGGGAGGKGGSGGGTTGGSGGATGGSGGATGGSGGATGGSGGATGGSGGATGGSGGATGGSGGSGGTGGNCPASPPPNGSSCTPPWNGQMTGAHCSWGDDPRPSCRTTALCTNGSWQVTPPDATACAGPPLPATCPSSPPADTTVCANQTLQCWYPDGVLCWCSGCKGGSGYPNCQVINPPEWYCKQPGTGCPTKIPQAGSPCNSEGASCGPSCELPIVCKDGVWQWLGNNCPICAAPDTLIATPSGERPIASLEPGDLVYSVDHDAIVPVPLVRVGRTPVSAHRVVRVVLETGRVLELSPGHPTADGRSFADLTAGTRLDEQHRVASAELVAYRWDATYDVLPASSTGTYFAAGALVGSTMLRAR